MATYTPVSSTVPDHQRTAIITDVSEGDRIDIVAILGRPARGVEIRMENADDSFACYLNTKKKLIKRPSIETIANCAARAWSAEEVIEVWQGATADVAPMVFTGATVVLPDGLIVSSIQVESMTPVTAVIVVW